MVAIEDRIRVIESHRTANGLSEADRLALLDRDIEWLISQLGLFLELFRELEEGMAMVANPARRSNIVVLPGIRLRE